VKYLILLVLLLAVLASGQSLETIIQFPESVLVTDLCYNSMGKKVYCLATTGIVVIDAASNEVVKTIALPDWAGWICLNPRENKLYCRLGAFSQSAVAVIDCDTDSVVSLIPTPGYGHGACYNPNDNKLYCLNNGESPGDSTVTIIDCTGDSVLVVLRVTPDGVSQLCHHPATDRVYVSCWAGDSIAVIDGRTNQQVRTLGIGQHPTYICSDYERNKIYCARSGGEIVVIDGADDRVLARLPGPEYPFAVAFDPAGDKVYCLGEDALASLVIVDAVADTVSACSDEIGGVWPGPICFDSLRGKVYLRDSRDDSVAILSERADTVLLRVGVVVAHPAAYMCMSWFPESGRVYVSGNAPAISVIRDTSFPGVAECPMSNASRTTLDATILRCLPVGSAAFDAMGRRVSLAKPGVYFVSEAQAQAQAVRKVVITR
jgi:DNA-binding beta-propeller fold protein YncE